LDVLEGAPADVVEAGLTAMQEGEVGRGGEVGESAGKAAELVAGLAVGQDDAVGEQAVADGVEGRSLFSGG
jgi:hypothetical protein